MRSLRLFALLAPALLLPIACEDSGSSSGGTFTPEAGPGFEAGPSPEAGPVPDAAVDAPATLGVTVTVTDGVTPKNAVRVILHDAAGAVIGETQTDATGKATIAKAPSMITVLGSTSATAPTPVTFLGVADGDKLTVDVRGPVAVDPVQAGTYSVGFAANGVTDGATLYQAYVGGSCYGQANDAANPIPVPLYDTCLGAQSSALVLASGPTGTLGFAFAKNLAKPAALTPVDVTTNAFNAAGATQIKATNLPEGGVYFARLGAIANGSYFSATAQSGTLDTALDFATPTGFAEAYQSTVIVESHPGGATAQKAILRREPTTAPAAATLPTFDMATALPLLTTPQLVETVAARAEITIKSEAPIAGADFGVLRLLWVTPGGTGNGRWTVVLPPGTTSVKLPALPADAALFAPVAPIDVRTVSFFDSSLIPGYKEAKALPVPAYAPLDLINEQRPLPLAGSLRFTHLDTQVD